MAILDDLKGILSPADFAVLEGNAALKTKIEKGDELYGYYVGEEPPAAKDPVVVDPPPAKVPPSLDLSGIERMFDARLAKLPELIDQRLEAAVKTRGDELVNNAVKISVQRADELNRLYHKHQEVTGKAFDSAEFNTFLEKPENKGKFKSITEAGDAYLSPQVTDREVDRRVAAKLAEESGKHVTGTTPPPSGNSNIRVFMGRNKSGETGATTGASRAAALLDKRMAREQELAS